MKDVDEGKVSIPPNVLNAVSSSLFQLRLKALVCDLRCGLAARPKQISASPTFLPPLCLPPFLFYSSFFL